MEGIMFKGNQSFWFSHDSFWLRMWPQVGSRLGSTPAEEAPVPEGVRAQAASAISEEAGGAPATGQEEASQQKAPGREGGHNPTNDIAMC